MFKNYIPLKKKRFVVEVTVPGELRPKEAQQYVREALYEGLPTAFRNIQVKDFNRVMRGYRIDVKRWWKFWRYI